jgi:hypothetical protein
MASKEIEEEEREESHVKMEAKISYAAISQEISGATPSWKRKERLLPRNLQSKKGPALKTPWFWTSGLEKTFLLF